MAEHDLHHYIIDIVIPRMQERRGREELTETQIRERLERPPRSGKPGEFRELEEQVRRDIDGVDGKFASEIADVVYYCNQPNCPQDLITSMHSWLELLGIPLKTAQEFCIIKYELRIQYGDRLDHKVIEDTYLDKFIGTFHPELRTIWKNPIDP